MEKKVWYSKFSTIPGEHVRFACWGCAGSCIWHCCSAWSCSFTHSEAYKGTCFESIYDGFYLCFTNVLFHFLSSLPVYICLFKTCTHPLLMCLLLTYVKKYFAFRQQNWYHGQTILPCDALAHSGIYIYAHTHTRTCSRGSIVFEAVQVTSWIICWCQGFWGSQRLGKSTDEFGDYSDPEREPVQFDHGGSRLRDHGASRQRNFNSRKFHPKMRESEEDWELPMDYLWSARLWSLRPLYIVWSYVLPPLVVTFILSFRLYLCLKRSLLQVLFQVLCLYITLPVKRWD